MKWVLHNITITLHFLVGFSDTGEATADAYNDFSPGWTFDLFRQQMAESWEELKPYYMKLHSYVRMKMEDYYGPKMSHPLNYMPAHIFGNMWAQDWSNIENQTKPFPSVPSLDATNALIAQVRGSNRRGHFSLTKPFLFRL